LALVLGLRLRIFRFRWPESPAVGSWRAILVCVCWSRGYAQRNTDPIGLV